MLVYAAEQIFGAGKGELKLDYVEGELLNRGLKVDMAAIEAAVREMHLIESWESAIGAEGDDDGDEE